MNEQINEKLMLQRQEEGVESSDKFPEDEYEYPFSSNQASRQDETLEMSVPEENLGNSKLPYSESEMHEYQSFHMHQEEPL